MTKPLKESPGQEGRDTWKYRRKAVFVSMAFAMLSIIYILWDSSDTELMNTAVNAAFLFLGGVVLTYVGGACVDDYLQKKGNGGE